MVGVFCLITRNSQLLIFNVFLFNLFIDLFIVIVNVNITVLNSNFNM